MSEKLVINVKKQLNLSFTNEWHSLLSFDFLYSTKSCNKSSVIANGHLALTSRTAFRLKRNTLQLWDRVSSWDNVNELFVMQLCRKKKRRRRRIPKKKKTTKTKKAKRKTKTKRMNVCNSRFQCYRDLILTQQPSLRWSSFQLQSCSLWFSVLIQQPGNKK